MTTFTISSDTNIDACAGGTGGHVYNLSAGAVFTYDQDSRAGVNSSTSNSIERIVTAATGGTMRFDGRYVRLIPFTDGSGTLTIGATIDCGDATGTAIAIYTSLTAAPADTGASGWIKVKGWNSVAYPTSGEFTQGGFTFTISGADVVGWIEVLADEGTTAEPGLAATVPSAGSFEMLGEWFELGDTNGSEGQTFQIPTNGQYCYAPGVFVEATAGIEASLEFWPNAGTATDIATDIRGKVCWIASTGVVTLGHNGSTAAGYTPGSGRRVVIGNIITSHCTAAARTANVIPNATFTNRFQIGRAIGSGGNYTISKANLSWYPYLDHCSQISIANTGIHDVCNIRFAALKPTLTNVGIGQSAAIDSQYQLVLNGLASGIDLTRVVVSRAYGGSSATLNRAVVADDCIDIVADGLRVVILRARTNAGAATINLNRCYGSLLSDVTLIGAGMLINGGTAEIDGVAYIDNIIASLNSYGSFVVESNGGSSGTLLSDVSFGGLTGDGVYPNTALATMSLSSQISITDIGSFGTPLSLGGVCPYVLEIGSGGVAFDFSIDRVYVSDDTALWRIPSALGVVSLVRVQNSCGDYADTPRPACSNMRVRGVRSTFDLSAYANVYGTHFVDCYPSTTTGRVAIVMNAPSPLTADLVTRSSGARFDGSGGLMLFAVNDTCTWEQDYYMIGHTGFDGAPVMAGGTASNYLIEYSIDLNDGTGWSDFEEATEANLEANNASIDAALGFKLKVRITCDTANTAAITSVYFGTTSTTTTQAYQYKIYETPVVVHAIDATTLAAIAGAAIYIEAGTGGEYTAGAEIGRGTTDSSGNCTIIVKHDAAQQINGVARKSSVTPFYSEGVLQATIAPGVTQTIVTALLRED